RPLAFLLNFTPRARRHGGAAHGQCHANCHPICHRTWHSDTHNVTFDTSCVKASVLRRKEHRTKDFGRTANCKSDSRRLHFLLALAGMLLFAAGVGAAEPESVGPQTKAFVEKFCVGCHNAKKDSGGLNLAAATDRTTWETVKRRVEVR